MKHACVLGGHGFIGHHLARRLLDEGYGYVKTVDIQQYPYGNIDFADESEIADLRIWENVVRAINGFDEVLSLCAWMGGAGVIFTGKYDAQIVHDNVRMNTNIADACHLLNIKKVFFASSACVYPQHIQESPDNAGLKESDAYPANPDSSYGLEKLFSENTFIQYHKNYDLDIRIARFHNVFGPEGTWNNGKEKAPAALCRKISEAKDGTSIDVWGDGKQTRSFIFVDEAVEAVRRLMQSDYKEPINIGSDEMISINDLAKMVIDISGKKLSINHIDGPQGVRGRNSDNTLIEKVLGWKPSQPLREGMEKTYEWINKQVNGKK